MIHLDFRDNRSIYAQVFDGFREQIARGILQPGEKLPSVRELASSLAINPNTIQRAYRELEVQGWISSVPGKGSFVRERRSADPAPLLQQLDTLIEQLLDAGLSREEISERVRRDKNA